MQDVFVKSESYLYFDRSVSSLRIVAGQHDRNSYTGTQVVGVTSYKKVSLLHFTSLVWASSRGLAVILIRHASLPTRS